MPAAGGLLVTPKVGRVGLQAARVTNYSPVKLGQHQVVEARAVA